MCAADDRRPRDRSTPMPPASTAALVRWSALPFEYRVLRQDPDAVGARGQPARRSCRCSSRCRTPTARTSPRSARCARCCRRRCSTSSRRAGLEWDTPIVGDAFPMPPIPGPDVYDLRARRHGKRPRHLPSANTALPTRMSRYSRWGVGSAPAVGSGQVRMRKPPSAATTSPSPGALTADGGALVANDMHLGIRVPNTWYRASLEWPDPSHRRGAAAPHRRDAAGRAGARRRQQHAHRVGLHQHLRRLERHRPARDVDRGEAEPLPHAGGLARVRAARRSRSRSPASPTQRDTVRWTIWGPVLGPDYRGRAARLPLGGAFRRASRHLASPPSSAHERSRRRSTWPMASARRARTSSWPTEAAGSAGASTARFRAGTASTAGCPRHGPMARAAGTAGWTMRSIRALPIRRAAASGRRTRVSPTATRWPSSATAATRSDRARGMIRDRLHGEGPLRAARPAGDPARHARGVPRAVAGRSCCGR